MNGLNIISVLVFLQLFSTAKVTDAQQVSESVYVTPGAINSTRILRNGRTLVVYGDPDNKHKNAKMVLFTDLRRDVVWAGRRLVENGAIAVAPLAQKSYFNTPDSVWSVLARTHFHEHTNRSTKVSATPVRIDRYVGQGTSIAWEDITFDVLDTPGYTRGAVSYFANIDNRRYAFTGDLLYGDGKVFDLYSFQDSLKGGIDGNHGYAARLGHLIRSLRLIKDQKPDIIVPSRGPVISNPSEAIETLIQRIHTLYSNYLSITAQRWNHTDRMITLSNHVLGAPCAVDWMPFSQVIENNPPAWYRHLNCGNIVFAGDSSAFLIDCGTKKDLENIIQLKQSGRIRNVDGIFITHYHYDHTDFVNQAVKEFGCPVYVTKELKDILENPGAYRMPSLTQDPIRNLTIVEEGQKLSWKEFKLTFSYFPGQTLYHDAMLMEKSNGEAIFFTGDSFTPAGIDDYCFQNRNFPEREAGYLYCLDVLKRLPDNVLLSNQHIKPLFRFSGEQLDHMTGVLADRNKIVEQITPWEDAGYATDDQWARIYPYTQKVSAGETVVFKVNIFNHSNQRKTFRLTPKTQKGFRVIPRVRSVTVDPQTESQQVFNVTVPEQATTGISLLLVDVKFDGWDLREWTEAIIEFQK